MHAIDTLVADLGFGSELQLVHALSWAMIACGALAFVALKVRTRRVVASNWTSRHQANRMFCNSFSIFFFALVWYEMLCSLWLAVPKRTVWTVHGERKFVVRLPCERTTGMDCARVPDTALGWCGRATVYSAQGR